MQSAAISVLPGPDWYLSVFVLTRTVRTGYRLCMVFPCFLRLQWQCVFENAATNKHLIDHQEALRRQRRTLLAGLAFAGMAYMAPGLVSLNEARAYSYSSRSRSSRFSRAGRDSRRNGSISGCDR